MLLYQMNYLHLLGCLWAWISTPTVTQLCSMGLPVQWLIAIWTESPGHQVLSPSPQLPLCSSLCSVSPVSITALCLLLSPGWMWPVRLSSIPLLANSFILSTQTMSPDQQRDLKAHCLSQTKFILCIQNWGGNPAKRALLQANYSSKKF